jgi:hypothetical protein
MALDRFRAPSLPNAPEQYDAQYMRQLLRSLELYFSQLDAKVDNHASKYTADEFVGGVFTGGDVSADSIVTETLTAVDADIGSLDAALIRAGGLIANQGVFGRVMAGDVYSNRYYGDGTYLTGAFQRYASFVSHNAASSAIAYVLDFDEAPFAGPFTLVSGTKMTSSVSGVVALTFDIQINSTSAGPELCDVWLRRNGVDVLNSNTKFTTTGKVGPLNSVFMGTQSYIGLVTAGDYFELIWSPRNTALFIGYYPAVAASPGVTPAIPATPSVVVTLGLLQRDTSVITRVAPVSVAATGSVGNVIIGFTPRR